MNDSSAVATDAKRTFISYASEDRARIGGLAPLLEALGHDVFFDQRALIPGQRWHQRIDESIESADALVVFWTRHAARSKWVSYEYERFLVRHPDGVLTAILGDETPLSPLLAERQATDFAPLINELLAMQRRLGKDGLKPEAVREAILKRLHDAGVTLDESRQRKLLRLFAPVGLAGLIAAPGAALFDFSHSGLHAIASLSSAQAVVVATAAVAGGVTCGALHPANDASTSGKAEPAVERSVDLSTQTPHDDLWPMAPPAATERSGLSSVTSAESAPSPSTVDCATISCDCPGIDAGILTGPWRDECRNQEAALRKQCVQENRFPRDPCAMSGPNTVPSGAS